MSTSIEIATAGEVEFSILTQHLQMAKKSKHKTEQKDTFHNRKYDLVATTTLSLSDYQDSVYTMVVLISPKYVIVNNLKSVLEVAQVGHLDTQSPSMMMESGDKLEWYWPDSTSAELIKVKVHSNNLALSEHIYSEASDDSEEETKELRIEEESPRKHLRATKYS